MANKIIGLTGGIGSGKTTIANMFIALGIDVIDADIVAREVVQPQSKALNAIAEHFGVEFINGDGSLNRSLLRSKIFSNEADKLWLNSLLHPLIRTSLLTELAASTSQYCLLVAPLLLENKLEQLVDSVLVIDVEPEIQIQRTLARDSSSANEVQAIINSQISRELRVAAADHIIDNSGSDLTLVHQQVTQLDNLFREMA